MAVSYPFYTLIDSYIFFKLLCYLCLKRLKKGDTNSKIQEQNYYLVVTDPKNKYTDNQTVVTDKGS